jgi:hypothetical protein
MYPTQTKNLQPSTQNANHIPRTVTATEMIDILDEDHPSHNSRQSTPTYQ